MIIDFYSKDFKVDCSEFTVDMKLKKDFFQELKSVSDIFLPFPLTQLNANEEEIRDEFAKITEIEESIIVISNS